MTSEKKNNKVATLLALVFLVAISAAAGYLSAKKLAPAENGANNLSVAKAAPEGGTVFYNRVVKAISLSAEGEVSNLTGESLTLRDNGEELTFKMVKEVRIFKVRFPPPPSVNEATPAANQQLPGPEEAALDDLKIGSRVSAMLSVTPEGLQAYSLTIFVQ